MPSTAVAGILEKINHAQECRRELRNLDFWIFADSHQAHDPNRAAGAGVCSICRAAFLM